MKKIIKFLALTMLLGLVACGEAKKEPLEHYTPLSSIDLGGTQPSVTGTTDGLGLLYSDKRGVVYKSTNAEVVVDSKQGADHWLYQTNSTLYAVWWLIDTTTNNKQKSIMVSTSTDAGKSFSTPTKLNSKTDALGEVAIIGDEGSNVIIAYADERQPGRFIYFNRSVDAGKTWQAEDARLDSSLSNLSLVPASQKLQPFANTVKLGVVNKKLIAVWQQADVINNQPIIRIVSKASPDFGQTWGDLQIVVQLDKPEAVELNAVSSDDAGMYVMAGLPDAAGISLYELKSSDQPWTKIDSSKLVTKDAQVSWFKPVISGKNLVFVFVEEKQGVKDKAKVATYLGEPRSWAGLPMELDKDKGHDLTRSAFPTITATEKEVMVAWEDYRPLIPAIYANVSKDNGKTWLPQAIRLTTDGLTISNLPILVSNRNNVLLFYITGQPSGENAKPFYAYQSFSLKDGYIQLPDIKLPMPSNEDRKALLIERANKFWALREERKWEETWAYMEPLYKQRFDKKEWIFNQDRLSYSKAVVDETSVDVNGNFGALKANVDVGMTNQIGKDGLIEATPAQPQAVTMRWGWFYDNWYFVPDVIFGNHLKF